MKKSLISLSVLALAACGGGSGSVHTVPENPANTPTYYANFKEYFDNVIKAGADGGTYSDFVEDNVNWPSQGGYKKYAYTQHTSDGNIRHIVNEKEMQLTNYGVAVSYNLGDGIVTPFSYTHNREGVGANLYTPAQNTIFTGGTLAYLTDNNNMISRIIKGDATYMYNHTQPDLLLEFDHYYTFNIVQQGGDYYTVTVSGENQTNNSGFNHSYDITPGTYYGNDAGFTVTHLQNGDIQEATGNYHMNFGDGKIGGSATNDFYMVGAFGGAHE